MNCRKQHLMRRAVAATVLTLGMVTVSPLMSPGTQELRSVIVQGDSSELVNSAIEAVGGTVTHDRKREINRVLLIP